MIRYTLKCPDGHVFESWFQSAQAFDSLDAAGHLSCATCGSASIEKSLMAPRVQTQEARPLEKPASDAEHSLAQMRKQVEENSDYVGLEFANEARAMHDGDAPSRAIYGEAKLDDAKKLIQDGVPVAPLPFMPKRNTN